MESNDYFRPTQIGINKVPLTRELLDKNPFISFEEGNCMANINRPIETRDRAHYVKYILAPLVVSGKVSYGPDSEYDDRKLFLDSLGSSFEEKSEMGSKNRLVLKFGISNYHAFETAMKRTPDENNRLKQSGLENYGDEYAYFPRAAGITGLVISSQGSAFVGTRDYLKKEGLQATAGNLNYVEDVKEINLETEALREAQEEFGINPFEFKKRLFVGAYEETHSGDVDFTYLLFSTLDNEGVKESFRDKREDKEHDKLIEIPSFKNVQTLLEKGIFNDKKYGLFPPTRGALMSIREGEMSD